MFLCIGAQKAGTTWLADNLKGHEDLLIAKRKEVHYFDVLDGQSPSTFRRAQRRVTSLLKKLPLRPGPNFDAAMEEIDSAYANLNIYRGGWHDHALGGRAPDCYGSLSHRRRRGGGRDGRSAGARSCGL